MGTGPTYSMPASQCRGTPAPHTHVSRSVAFALLCIACWSVAAFAHMKGDPETPSGLFFDGGGILATSSEGGTAIGWLGSGYAFGRQWSIALLIETGHAHVSSDAGRPMSGTMLVGGVPLELQYRWVETSDVTLFLGAGAGLFTLLREGAGYNGSGVQISAGASVQVFRVFDISPVLKVGRWWWFNGVGGGVEPFRRFSTDWAGIGISVRFSARR